MTDVGKNIKKRRTALMMSAETLAEKIGCSPATIYRYENGSINNVSTEKLIPIAKALRTTPEELMGWKPATKLSLPETITPVNKMHHHYVPLIGSVAAGEPLYCEENYDCVVDAPKKADFALRVEGESMIPNFLPGDIVYIRQQPDVEDGEVGVVLIDDSATLKHIYHTPTGLLLLSDNPKFKPMKIDGADHDCIRILGKCCGFTRMF